MAAVSIGEDIRKSGASTASSGPSQWSTIPSWEGQKLKGNVRPQEARMPYSSPLMGHDGNAIKSAARTKETGSTDHGSS